MKKLKMDFGKCDVLEGVRKLVWVHAVVEQEKYSSEIAQSNLQSQLFNLNAIISKRPHQSE